MFLHFKKLNCQYSINVGMHIALMNVIILVLFKKWFAFEFKMSLIFYKSYSINSRFSKNYSKGILQKWIFNEFGYLDYLFLKCFFRFVYDFGFIPLGWLITTLITRWLYILCLAVLNMHGNELSLFLAKAFPLLILLMSHIWHLTKKIAVGEK